MPSNPHRWRILAVVATAFFMTILDVSIVNVALPSISRALHFSRDNLQWVITAYSITFGGFLLLAGRSADILGRRRVFYVGVAVFTIASFLCGLAWSEGVLIGARAVQGLGAAIISPAALSIITTIFEEGPERNKALGIWGAIGGSGAAVGGLAGGVLTKYLGWEWIFFVNGPVGPGALLLTRRFVTASREGGGGRAALGPARWGGIPGAGARRTGPPPVGRVETRRAACPQCVRGAYGSGSLPNRSATSWSKAISIPTFGVPRSTDSRAATAS